MKNKMICTLLTTVMVLSFAACGSQGNGAAASTESTVASESQVTESNAEANTETASTESTSTAEGAYEDNFAVPTEDATAFAKKIQDAVAAEDLDALADLVNYPVYVALGDGSVIETREDLIALGADKIFTPELKDSMANQPAFAKPLFQSLLFAHVVISPYKLCQMFLRMQAFDVHIAIICTALNSYI